MKILLFSNTPSLISSKLNKKEVSCGWISSFEFYIKKYVNEIGIAFYFTTDKIEMYNDNNTTYYLIPSKKNKWIKWKNRILHIDERDKDIFFYLQIVKSFKPDIIQIFGTENAFGQIIKYSDVPVVLHIQGIFNVINLKYYSGLNGKNNKFSGSIKNLILGNGPYHYYKNLKKWSKREICIFKNVEYLLGRTKFDKYVSNILAPHARYFHCDEIIRELFYNYKWTYKKQEVYKITTVTRSDIYKGLETVYLTAELLYKLGIPFIWTVIGIDNNDEIVKIFRSIYKSSFQTKYVQLAGILPVQEVIDILLDTTVFVYASHIDNSSNSLAEAMLLGVPVISSSSGGLQSIISNNYNGILVQDGDPYSFAGAVIEIINNPELAKTISENAFQTARNRHNPETIIKNLLKVYDLIMMDYYVRKKSLLYEN